MEKINLILATNIHNQEAEIATFGKKISFLIKKLMQEEIISEKSYALFIDHNSKDNSWYEISKEKVRYTSLYKAIKLKKRTKNNTILSFLSQEKNALTILIDLKYSEEKYLVIENLKSINYGICELV